jgi:hypothetical protein
MNMLSVALSQHDLENKSVAEISSRDFITDYASNYGGYQHTQKYESPTAKSTITSETVPFVVIPKVAKAPRIHKFDKELECEGVVIAINQEDRTFTAKIIDVKSGGVEEEGDFSLDELDGDENLVMPGAIFTWVVGLQSRGTSKQRVSDIRFRRHTALPKAMIAEAESKAEELSKFFSEHESNKPNILKID